MAGVVSRAVAGGGKTTRLVEQYLDEVVHRDPPLDPSNVVVITFTEAAARELLDRIRLELTKLAPTSPRAVEVLDNLGAAPIGTIHAFARRVLLRNAVTVGVAFGVEVLDELDAGSEEQLKRRVRVRFQDFCTAYGIQDAHTQRKGYNGRPRYLRDEAQSLIGGVSGALLRQPEWSARTSDDLHAMEERAWQHFAALHTPPAGVMTASEARRALESAAEQLAIGAGGAAKEELRTAFEALLDEVEKLKAEVMGLPPEQAVASPLNPGRRSWVTGPIRKNAAACGIPGYPDLGDELKAHAEAVKGWAAELKIAYARVAGLLAVEAYLSIRDSESRDWLLQDELLQRCWTLLRDDGVAEAMRLQYPVIFLDEAQDVDATQRMMLLRIAGPEGLIVVGDPQQSIYGFRGADYATFEILQREVCGDDEPEHLSTTHRCQPPIVDAVNSVFAEDPHHTPLQTARAHDSGTVTFLDAQPDAEPDEVRPGKFRSPSAADYRVAQADAVADQIVELLRAGGRISEKHTKEMRQLRPSDIAILVNARTPVSTLEKALKERGVGVSVRTSRDMARHPLTEGLAAALLAIIDPADTRALLIALRSPLFACRDDDLTAHVLRVPQKLRMWGSEESGSVAEALIVLRRAVDVYRRKGAAEALAALLRDCEVSALFAVLPEAEEAWAEIRLMVDLVADRERTVVETDREFVAWFTDQLETGGKTNSTVLDEISGDDVTITTIHQAKGLEWPVVVVTGFPSERDSATSLLLGDTDVYTCLTKEYAYMPEDVPDAGGGEENRLLYVALTRARDHLIVSGIAPSSKNASALTRAEHLQAALTGLPGVRVVEVPVHLEHRAARSPVTLAPRVLALSGPGDVEERLKKLAASSALTIRREVPSDHGATASVSPAAAPLGYQSNVLGELVHGVMERVDLAELAAFPGTPMVEELLSAVAPEVGAGEPELAAARAMLRNIGLSKTVQRAAAARIVRRELPISGNRVAEDGAVVVTQGIIDLLFSESAGSWVLADYKTDSTDRSEADFVAMYRDQLLTYRRLLAEVGVDVSEMWLVRLRPDGVEDVAVPG